MVVPSATDLIKFAVSVSGVNAGVDNGYSSSDELFQSDHRSAFQGRALLVVRSRRQAGQVTIRATAEGMPSAETVLDVVQPIAR